MRSEYESYTTSGAEAAYRELEYRIMEDVVRRIRKAEKITSTADYQLQRLQILGYSSKDIEDIVRKAVDGDYPETFRLYDQVIEEQYVRSKDMYEQVNEQFIPYEQNYELQQLTQSLIEQTNGELTNITKSMGFMIDMAPVGQPSRLVFTPLSEVYNGYLDKAILDVASGATDYNSAIRKVVKQMTASGLRTVDYASGRTSRVDVAARRAIMNGLSQLTRHIVDSNAEKLGAEFFEVDWHSGARPSHQEWEGQVWSKSELESVCGLGAADGLLGINCYHMYWPFFPGVSERNWTDEWLQEQHEIENTPIEFKGKEYTRYEATQRQRYLETNMRAQRETVDLLKAGKADPDDVTIQRCKYQAMLEEYRAFSKAMNLPVQTERIYYDMRGRVSPSVSTLAKYTPEMIRNAEIDSAMYYRRRDILGQYIGTLAEFRQVKYNNTAEFEKIEHAYNLFCEINAKPWGSLYKQKNKEAYIYLRDRDTFTNIHSIARITQRVSNDRGMSLDDIVKQWHMKPNYLQPDGRKIRFYNGMAIIGQDGDKEIATVLFRNNPRNDWTPL